LFRSAVVEGLRMKAAHRLVLAFAMLPWCAVGRGETFYLSPSGDDANIGTSAEAAWRSLDKINALTLRPGDRVLLQGGATFQGGIFVGPEDSGTAQNPVFFGSYGAGRATIRAGGSAFSAQRVGGLEIANLQFVGTGALVNTGRGINLYNDAPDMRPSFVRIHDVDVSGFSGSGISVGALPGAVGFRDVRISNAVLHHNGEAGLSTFGPTFDSASPSYAHEDLLVSGVLAYDNSGIPAQSRPTGSGITLSSVNGGVVEHSVAHDNGRLNTSPSGPVGIWAYDANAVVIQHNRSYNNGTGWNGTQGGDGGGFDLDRNTSNSLLQYNFSFGNDGPGFMAYTDQTNDRHAGNVIRYNISHADGRRNGYGGIVLLGALRELDVHNNTVLFPGGAFGLNPAALKIGGVGGINPRVRIADNIFQTDGGGTIFIAPDDPDSLRLMGNDYWAADGSFRLLWGDIQYSNLEQWLSAAPTIERDGGRIIAWGDDPRFAGLDGNGGFVGVGAATSLNAYRLIAGSPLVDGAFDLRTLGLHPGTVDLYGTQIAQGNAYDLGAAEQAVRIWQGRSTQNTWADPSNWNPTGPPLSGDSALLSYSGTGEHTIEYSNPDPTTHIHLFRLDSAGQPSGHITFLHGRDELSTAIAEIGYGGRATYQLTGGVHRVGLLILGHNAGAQGDYVITAGELNAANLMIGFAGRGNFAAAGGLTRALGMTVGGLDTSGEGTFDASGSAAVEVGRLQIGATGRANITGAATVLVQDAWVQNGGVLELSGGSITTDVSLRNSGDIHGTGTLTSWGSFVNEGRLHLGAQTPAAPGSATATFFADVSLSEGSELRIDAGSVATFFGRVTAPTGSSVFTGAGDKTFSKGSAVDLGFLDTQGATSIESGASVRVDRIRERALRVDGTISLRPGGGDLGTSRLESLTIGQGGRMDLAEHALILDYDEQSPLKSIFDAIASAYREGDQNRWTGPGLTSSAAVDPLTGVGFGEAAAVLANLPGNFAGQDVDDTSVLVRLTLLGDANLDGRVDVSDFMRVRSHFGQNATWSEGDFDYDGWVTFADFQLLEQNFGLTLFPSVGSEILSAPQFVPEPGSAILLAACTLLISRASARRSVVRVVRS
jgi:hypothetical protein